MLLDRLPEWQQKGYISVNVWEDMETIVDSNLLPAREMPSGGKGETKGDIHIARERERERDMYRKRDWNNRRQWIWSIPNPSAM